ncbi:MAG: diaminopimelate decarboxylase [Oscillospiraceae bacterium]|nr:diaminopimelate decarboxylase [Oscillospiraceae bacterium]
MTDQLPFTLAQARAWREHYPTPFYIYDEAGIRRCVNALRTAFAWNPGFREYFAVKATPTPAILRLLSSLGCGTDCASVTELLLSVRCGIRGGNIMFSSNETTAAEYRAAAAAGAIINLDDLTQLARMEETCGIPDTVCCRYNPGSFRITNEIMGHLYDSKFGMTKPQLFAAYAALKEKGVRRFGLHAMLASCSLDNDYYPALARELFSLALELREKLNITLSFVDFSGGVGIPYRPEERAVNIAAIGARVHEVYDELLTANGISLDIYTEMGRYITGPYGYLLTTAIGKKHIYKEYVGVDASASDLMRPAMYGAYHHITVLGKETAPCTTTVDVVGALCENNDKFAIDRPLPPIDDGDILVIQDAGAHGHSMGYNYNGRLRCAELLLHPDGTPELIRRAETAEDYFATLDVDAAFSQTKETL